MNLGSQADLALLRGETLHLRPVEITDVGDAYCLWLNDPLVNRYLETRFLPQTLDTIRAFVESISCKPDELLLAICENAGARHVGNIKLGPINRNHGYADISLFIGAKDCWGKGYATEAIRLLSRFAFEKLGVRKLQAGAYSTNLGSIRTFEKVGFAREGVMRNKFVSDGKPVDHVVLGLCKKDPIS